MSEYRLIDLSEWEKSGAGANSESYINADKTQMLKLFKNNATEETAAKDLLMAQKVASLGIETPEVYEIVKVGEKFGVIYQNLNDKKSYSRLIADAPEKVNEYAKAFAAKAKELHATPCDTELFNSNASAVRKGIEMAKYIDSYKPKLYEFVSQMESHTTCLHGDLQTGNLVNAQGCDYWIDFDRFSYGDPIIDIAHMYTVYQKLAWFPYIQNLFHMNKKLLRQFWTSFIKEYFGVDESGIQEINERLEAYNLLDLVSRNYRQPGLISDLVTLILVKPQLKKYFR